MFLLRYFLFNIFIMVCRPQQGREHVGEGVCRRARCQGPCVEIEVAV